MAGNSKVTDEQRRAIIALRGCRSAESIGETYGLTTSGVKSIWFKERKARGETPTKLSGGGTRYSALTGMVVAHDFDEESPYLRPIESSLQNLLLDPLVETGKTLVNLGPEDCRWRIGKDAEGEYRFCACQRVGGHDCRAWYCDGHAKRVTRRKHDGSPAPRNQANPEYRVIAKLFHGELGTQGDIDSTLDMAA